MFFVYLFYAILKSATHIISLTIDPMTIQSPIFVVIDRRKNVWRADKMLNFKDERLSDTCRKDQNVSQNHKINS